MKPSSTFSALAAVALASFVVTSEAHATECNVKSNRAVFGASLNAGFDIRPGHACTYGYSSGGMMKSAKITQQAQHGSVRLRNNSSFEYRAKPGYAGSDAFVIEATGRDTLGTGASVLTYNITVR
jgi:hypothetical protein